MMQGVNHWPDYMRFRNEFAKVLDTRLYTIEWLDEMVYKGIFRLWATADSAIIAKIKTYPTGAREVHGMIAAGDIAEIVSLIPNAEEWGRQEGCILGSISSHPAWQRIMKRDGYEPIQTVLQKEL